MGSTSELTEIKQDRGRKVYMGFRIWTSSVTLGKGKAVVYCVDLRIQIAVSGVS